MSYNPDKHHCRSIRLKGYDYSQVGAYFVTICTQDRICWLGDVVDGEMRLNASGQMVCTAWNDLPNRYANIELDAFVAMPNHIHGIIILYGRGESCIRPASGDQQTGDHKDRPYGTLNDSVGRIVQAFKSITTHHYINGVRRHDWNPFSGKLWQRNYYEHIIRSEESLNHIRQYILDNPLRWEFDRENPAATKPEPEEIWRV